MKRLQQAVLLGAFILPAFWMSTRTFSQDRMFGIKTGILYSDISHNDYFKDTDPGRGLGLWLTYDKALTKHVSFGIETGYEKRLFLQKQYWINEFAPPPYPQETTTNKYYLNYFTLPVKVQLNFGDKVSGFCSLGLMPCLLINASLEQNVTPQYNMITSPPQKQDITTHLYEWDFAAFAESGVGYWFRDNYKAELVLRYQRSFVDVAIDHAYWMAGIRQFQWSLSLGVKYVRPNQLQELAR